MKIYIKSKTSLSEWEERQMKEFLRDWAFGHSLEYLIMIDKSSKNSQ